MAHRFTPNSTVLCEQPTVQNMLCVDDILVCSKEYKNEENDNFFPKKVFVHKTLFFVNPKINMHLKKIMPDGM